MISSGMLIRIARKWQKKAAINRRRIPLPKTNENGNVNCTASRRSSMVDKGHFVVYTLDKKRFSLPVKYLNSCLMRQLFVMSEEEFGHPRDGPITLPCKAMLMELIVSAIQGHTSKDMEKALLRSITTDTCSFSSSSAQQILTATQLLVCS